MSSDSEVEMRLISSGRILGLPGIGNVFDEISVGAERLYAAVAYVTYIPTSLKGLLEEGFLCSDIHNPTSLELLKSNHKLIPTYLHLKMVKPAHATKGHNHLLHSKLLLFESSDKATIIIGSHNWTKRAIPGINIEDSILIQVPLEHELHIAVKDQLYRIKNSCTRFDVNDYPLYQAIQNKLEKQKLETLISIKNSTKYIPNGADIVIFGDTFENYFSVVNNQDKINSVQVQEKYNPSDYSTYDAEIIRAGKLPKSDSLTKPAEFFEVYQALWISGSKLPEIINKCVPPISVNDDYNYFIHIRISNPKDVEILHKVEIPKRWEKTGTVIHLGNEEAFSDESRKSVDVYTARVDFFKEEWNEEKQDKKIQHGDFEFIGKYHLREPDEETD
jgi:hypothetical protein